MLTQAGVYPMTGMAGRRLGLALVRGEDHRHTRVNEVLVHENAPFADERTLVVAIGSNASPRVIRRKYKRAERILSWATPFMTGTLDNMGIGHSAHVSGGGYIAATPYALPGSRVPVVASWFDAAQLQVVDLSEPNYDRVLVSGESYPLTLDSGERPEFYYIYLSNHGLILDEALAAPIKLMSQRSLFEFLRCTTSRAVFAGQPDQVSIQLKDPDHAVAAAEAIRGRGVAGHGLIAEQRKGTLLYGDTRNLAAESTAYRVLPTSSPMERRRQPVVAISGEAHRRLRLGSHALVASAMESIGRPGVVAGVVVDDSVPLDSIQADQLVRNALGVERQESVLLSPANLRKSRLGDFLLGRPTVLLCRVEAADLANVEREVVLCDSLALDLLGVDSNSQVVIEGCPSGVALEAPTLRIRAVAAGDEVISRRSALAGGTLFARYPNASDALGVFPDLPRVFLDADQRRALGLGAHKLGAVRVMASRSDQALRELRELMLVLALAFIGIVTAIGNWFVVAVFAVVLLGAMLVVRARLRSQLGLRDSRRSGDTQRFS